MSMERLHPLRKDQPSPRNHPLWSYFVEWWAKLRTAGMLEYDLNVYEGLDRWYPYWCAFFSGAECLEHAQIARQVEITKKLRDIREGK